jgi:hypothetical protein
MWRALVLVVLAVLLPATPAAARDTPRVASFERLGVWEFDGVDGDGDTGSLALVSTGEAFDGWCSAWAWTPGGSGNRFARGTFDVRWEEGADVWYGAAFYLPPEFYEALDGQVEVLRWDNWSLDGRTRDQGGLAILPDGRWALMRKSAGAEEQELLTEPIAPPAPHSWHRVEIHQRLAADATALNELWIDGERVAMSRERNWYGRPVTAVRAGIVAINAEQQRQPLGLGLDLVGVGTNRWSVP